MSGVPVFTVRFSVPLNPLLETDYVRSFLTPTEEMLFRGYTPTSINGNQQGGRPWSFTPYNQLRKEVNSSTTVQEALHGARIHSGEVTL